MQELVYMANAHGLRGVDSMNYMAMIQALLAMDGIVLMNCLLVIVINLKEQILLKQVLSFQALGKTMLELYSKSIEKTSLFKMVTMMVKPIRLKKQKQIGVQTPIPYQN